MTTLCPGRGFALVVTIPLVVLLSLLVIGLLSLSVVSMRSGSHEAARAEAQANARLGLMLALGQLQKHAGDDRRVSIAADQIPSDADGSETAAVPGRRFWTGIYDSWEAGQPQRPEPVFRAWLVSSPGTSQPGEDAPTGAGGTGPSVRLLGPGSVGDDPEDWVEAPLLDLEPEGRLTGRTAWWTGDEGLKAMVATPPVGMAGDLAEVRSRLQAAPSFGVQVASTGAVEPFHDIDRSDRRIAALTGWPQASLLAADRQSTRQLFHDLTTRTSGLLVDVREGGFRRDFSMEFARPEEEVRKDPLYTVNSEPGINFQELYAYYTLPDALEHLGDKYTYTTGGTIPRGTMGLKLPDSRDESRGDGHFYFKIPAMVSNQIAFSFWARPLGSEPDAKNRIYLVLDPVVTFWNPLDVPLVIPTSMSMTAIYYQFPYSFIITADGVTYDCPIHAAVTGARESGGREDTYYLGMWMGGNYDSDQIVLRPGEVLKLSQAGGDSTPIVVQERAQNQYNQKHHNLSSKAGFNYGSGVARPMQSRQGQFIEVGNDATITYSMQPNELTFGKTSQSGNSLSGQTVHTDHYGLHADSFFIGHQKRENNTIAVCRTGIDPPRYWAGGVVKSKSPEDRLYADQPKHAHVFSTFGASETRPLSIAQLKAAKAPVLMYTYSIKTEKTSPRGTRTMLRYNPNTNFHTFYDLAESELDLMPIDIQVEVLNSWVNRKLETSPKGNGYFGGSYDAADGTSFVNTHSVPREPIHSLGALQHSMANGFASQKPGSRRLLLPQISHAIGNSLAPGVLAANETSTTISGDRVVADHSYLANEALWDGWFFSSIASQEAMTFPTKRSQREVAEQFLDGTADLPIVHYQADLGAMSASEALAELFSGPTPTAEAVDLMASLIRVEGMFNVNSTSVEAWRALLSSLLGEDIVTRDPDGRVTRKEVEKGVPVVGLMAPVDAEAKGQGLVNPRDPEQWVGRRTLSEEEITELAEAIVAEVRKRGPFLSLADFVNRRVEYDSDDPALARAGAIQSVLDSEEVSVNQAYNQGDRAVTAETAKRLRFPEAEQGAASTGIAGIVKQADLLTPLAPVLSARSDTFLIRTYGEAVDASGKVIARAWCEAQVQRDADYIDRTDRRDVRPGELTSRHNQLFGRRFNLISFRWLSPEEI